MDKVIPNHMSDSNCILPRRDVDVVPSEHIMEGPDLIWLQGKPNVLNP